MRSMAMPSRSHQTDELGEIEQRPLGLAKGTPLSERMASGQAALAKQPLEGGEGRVFSGRFERLAQEQVARGLVGDRQRVTVAAVAELELALEVGAPQIVGRGCPATAACRWRDARVRAACA